jgi:hypothetical protein
MHKQLTPEQARERIRAQWRTLVGWGIGPKEALGYSLFYVFGMGWCSVLPIYAILTWSQEKGPLPTWAIILGLISGAGALLCAYLLLRTLRAWWLGRSPPRHRAELTGKVLCLVPLATKYRGVIRDFRADMGPGLADLRRYRFLQIETTAGGRKNFLLSPGLQLDTSIGRGRMITVEFVPQTEWVIGLH